MSFTGIIIPLALMILSCLVIWKSATGFETASDYLGRKMSKGVKGATINAIASSMPEFLSTVFFLFYLRDVNGFSGGLGITAGSAIFNLLIIPALVILVVFAASPSKIIRITRGVILRDGIFLIATVGILIIILHMGRLSLHPRHGLILLLAYLVYLVYMFVTMGKLNEPEGMEYYRPVKKERKVRALYTLNLPGLIIGSKQLRPGNGWALLLISTAVMSFGTWLLVYSTAELSEHLGIPILFIAVVLSAAASSVPDTVLSVKDARKGNYDDAISNALGSNIFDISFALGLPLMLYTLLFGPIEMDPTIARLSTNLWIFLLVTTVLGFAIFITGRTLNRLKAILYLLMYGGFVVFIILEIIFEVY